MGRVPTDPALHGPVEVLVRPEHVRIEAASDGDAKVVGRSYYGPDQLVRLELARGGPVRSRVPGTGRWADGDTVRGRVTGAAMVLDAAAQSGH